MLPNGLKQELDAQLLEAAASGDDALEQTAGGLAEALRRHAAQATSPAEAISWLHAARHAVCEALRHLPQRWRLHLLAGRIHFEWSQRINDLAEQLSFLAKAEQHYRCVLTLQPDRLGALHHLGILLKRRGDLATGVAQRLSAYQEAEACFQRSLEIQPNSIDNLNALGLLLQDRQDLEPTRAARLAAYAESERLHRQVLKLQPGEITALGNIGLVLWRRGTLEPGRAERNQRYKEAERLYRGVLEIQPSCVSTLNNLGVLLQGLGGLEHGQAERLQAYEEAERCYQRVLDIQPNHIEALANLAVLFKDRVELMSKVPERLAAYKQAEAIYRQIIELKPDHVAILVNFGQLLNHRGNIEPERNSRLTVFQMAETCFRRVLDLQPNFIAALNNLAVLEFTRAQFERGAKQRHLANATVLSAHVLEFQPAEVKAMCNLFNAQLDALQLEDGAAGWTERTATSAELLERRHRFAAVTTDPHFRNELGSAAWPLGPLGAVCHLRAGDPAAAVAHLDANMAMSLAEALATPERRLIELEHIGEAAAAQHFVLARDALAVRIAERVDLLQAPRGDTEEAESARQAEIEALSQEIEDVEQERDVAIADIRAISGFDDFLRPGGDIGLIKAAAKERPLVYLAASPWGGHALVVHGEAIEDVPLPDLNDEAVAERLEAWQGRYHAVEVASEAHGVARFAVVEGNSAAERRDRDQAKRALDEALTDFDAATRALCRWLGEAVMQPVLAALERHHTGRAVLLPSGQLTYLPLHAAIVGGNDERPVLALERLQLSYAANARLARDSAARLRRQPQPGLPGLVAIVDPAYADLGHRHAFGPAEAAILEEHAAAGRLELTCHAGANARVTLAETSEDGAFPIRELAQRQILHLGCHGRAEHVDVFNSRLQLAAAPAGAGDQMVTIEEVLDTWPVDQLRLVVLSCCEGAMSGRQSFDELVSLQTAFAQGGAAAVVGAMWAVRDDHTADLMRHFYDALLTDPALDPAKALATAQALLLDTTPEAFPSIAAFQVLQG